MFPHQFKQKLGLKLESKAKPPKILCILNIPQTFMGHTYTKNDLICGYLKFKFNRAACT